ncbi:hypothetical protein MXB_1735, partial [Myxobolus squamalis]
MKCILSTFENYVDNIEERFGANLYIAANQKSRCSALNYYEIEKIDIVKYCIAEIIGRCRENGFEQIGLINHCIDSEPTYYEVNWLIFKKIIIKISHLNNYPEIPQNLLILKRFYNQNKLPQILYINQSLSSIFPYDYAIKKAFEIINIHHRLSIKPFNSNYFKLKTPSFQIPFEANLMSIIFHIVNKKKQDGCTIKELVFETSTDLYMCRSLLKRLEKEKMLYTTKSIVGKIHTLKYYSMQFKNHSQEDKISVMSNEDGNELKLGKCSIDIKPFIDRYIASQLNIKEKYINCCKTTFHNLSRLIEDLIVLKIINTYTLKVKYLKNIIEIKVYTIFSKNESLSHWNNVIIHAFFDEINSNIYKNNVEFVENENVLTKIWNCQQNNEVFHFEDCGVNCNNIIQNLSDLDKIWVEEQYKFLKRLIENNLKNSQFFPKFTRAKYFHFYLYQLINRFENKNMKNCQDSSFNKKIYKYPWLKAVGITSNHINGKGWFT